MRLLRALAVLLTGIGATGTIQTGLAQTANRFPPPKSIFTDVKYKEPKEKSAIEFGPGNTIIVRGEGTGSPKTFNVLSFSADGKLLAAGKNFGRVVVWHMPSQQILCAVEGSQGQVTAVAFSSDGQFLATTGQGDKLSLKLWHLPECKLAHTYRFTHSFIKSLAFVPKSSSLVVWDNASTTYVLNSKTEDPPLELKGAFRPVLSEDGTIADSDEGDRGSGLMVISIPGSM